MAREVVRTAERRGPAGNRLAGPSRAGYGRPVRPCTAFDRFRRRLRSLEVAGLRLVRGSDGSREVFDLRADPQQTTDLSGRPGPLAAEAARLSERLDRFVAQGGGPRPLPAGEAPADAGFGELPEATAEQLRELGYLR